MKNPIIDLHCHSTISDGLLTPTELVNYAKECHVKVMALTDHDDIAGLDEARLAAKDSGIVFINGVEISVTWNKRTLHIVGLNFDKENDNLVNGLKEIRVGRDLRAKKMAHSLGMAGIMNAYEGARSYAKNSTIGRIHFAQFIVEKGYAKDIKSVFKKYLTPGKPGFFDHQWVTLEEAVTWITMAGGDAVIAHPGRYDMGNKLYPKLFSEFRDFGGSGVEVISGSQDPSQTNYFCKLANDYNLLGSCGSDFHGHGISHRAMGSVNIIPELCQPIWSKWHHLIESIH
ncbi:MAG: PHP domain-containing protein [Methylophilales bacterium]|jgi:3',5'-nucleoside bisphosphate phosphatase|nr:PHP domain-containing protein [Pseudomonadota bacterium]NQW35155.1 PHP domain-containing protein [Methylophilales bacterium]HCK04675.1 phosphatase [Methylophilaceae bacterium]|tara:strand:+ start:19431 stop:20288 length:858 start_codon:yes stop_codon:yes gene_type:complete